MSGCANLLTFYLARCSGDSNPGPRASDPVPYLAYLLAFKSDGISESVPRLPRDIKVACLGLCQIFWHSIWRGYLAILSWPIGFWQYHIWHAYLAYLLAYVRSVQIFCHVIRIWHVILWHSICHAFYRGILFATYPCAQGRYLAVPYLTHLPGDIFWHI